MPEQIESLLMIAQEKSALDLYLTTSGVARLLNVHINTVRRWSDQGVLKSYRIGPRGDRCFNEDDIVNFVLNEETSTSKSRTP